MYQKRIWAVISGGVLIVFVAAALAVVSVRAADTSLRQARVAHELLEQHLTLSVHSYRLFKQLTDEIVLGRGANQAIVRNKRGAIKDVLTRIRELEWNQRLSLGEAATQNSVEDTDALEELIESIIADFEGVLAITDSELRARGIDTILEDRIDIGFREAVNAALSRQRAVVRRMEEQVSVLHSRLAGISVALALGALIAGVLGSVLLIRGIARPMQSLQEGAVRLADGDWGYRVPRGWDQEFDAMAGAFNAMADRLETQHQAMDEQRRDLELAVAERTQEITEANVALKRSDDVRRQFFADMSHELRTPITVIRGESQVALRAGELDVETYRESLQAILDQSVAMSRLVEDMLFIARTDAKGMRLNRRELNLQQLVQDVARDMRQRAETRDIKIQIESDQDLPLCVFDPDRARQLVLILLENAIRYSPDHSCIKIELTTAKNHLRMTVSDQGYGIDPQDLPHIFERFFRGHESSKHEQSGTGLGLAIAKAIVDAHAGEIVASRNPDRGSRFVVTLPIQG